MCTSSETRDTDSLTEHSPLKQSVRSRREKGSCDCVAARHVLAIWGFFGFVNLFTLRVDLSVSLVAMVNNSNNHINNSNQSAQYGNFTWGEGTQGIILGSFFCGYFTTQIPGGWLAVVVGGKRLFGLGIMVTSLLTLFTPMAASFSLYALIAVRVLEGAAQGIAFPSMHTLLGKWAPVWERSRLVSFTYAGGQIGTIITLLMTGIICDSSTLGGWPSTFYIFGAAGFLWSIGWMIFIYDCPAQHPRITKEELKYIEDSIGETSSPFNSSKRTPIPWRKIFLCKGLWAIVAAHMAADWGCFTMMTCLPQFMKKILKFDLKQDGIISSLPYMVLFLTNTISGPAADYIRGRGLLSTKATRKLMNSIGLLVPVGFMVSVGYAGHNPTLVIALLCLAIGLNGFTLAGYSVNHLDIAPKYAGLMMSISNTFGTTTGFIGPAVVGALTNHNETMAEWRIFFFITAGVFATGGLVFLFLSEGEPAAWYHELTVQEEQKKLAVNSAADDKDQKAIYIPDKYRRIGRRAIRSCP
ncbi:sialin-like [Gigantopelta aegis]|uniref:sialin-like n=1 Tax=Gigantopelta aegis TaxID=1735272 RepID=UPI001B889FB1|nr:sialin-like [Gigantopelta aegis]